VNGRTLGLKLNIIKPLTFQERLILLEQLKTSNDMLSQLEREKVKRLEDREKELDKLFKEEIEQRLENENKLPQETIVLKKFEEMPDQNKITEVNGVEGNF